MLDNVTMIERDALIDGHYRYWLSRKNLLDKSSRKCLFICINPNTADKINDDRTTITCMNFAKNFGCGHLYIVNLFAMKGKPPKSIIKKPNSIGKDNDKYILEYAKLCSDKDDLIIVAWGDDCYKDKLNRAKDVKNLLRNKGYKLYCLKINKTKEPHHPLYLKETSIQRPKTYTF
jgi:hypothetical protein